jgi:hypothetical protein
MKKKSKGATEAIGDFTNRCPLCHKIGLVLMYNYATNEANFICGARELPNKQFWKGCNAIVYHFPLDEKGFLDLIRHDSIQENFFIMHVLLP